MRRSVKITLSPCHKNSGVQDFDTINILKKRLQDSEAFVLNHIAYRDGAIDIILSYPAQKKLAFEISKLVTSHLRDMGLALKQLSFEPHKS
jgi:hypothetical protein